MLFAVWHRFGREKKKLDGYTEVEDVILLFENYSLDSQRLHTSFKLAGCEHIAVTIEDDGFLPEDVMSVYGFFIEAYRWKLYSSGIQRKFNEIISPDCWEKDADIDYESCMEKGRIIYIRSSIKRHIKTVNWYDERNVMCSSDHYNRYGGMYARTIWNDEGQGIQKFWFSPEGRNVIIEDLISGSITLKEDKETMFFERKHDFVVYFFLKTGFWQKRIFFNSLSTPFFVSNRLQGAVKGDILFWQESIGDEIPGNMRMILEGRAVRTMKIVVQKRHSYERLLELGAEEKLMRRLGYIYRFKKENSHRAEALICTNSENVEHCREIVKEIPQMHFHIAAVTAMSEKLLGMGEYENVILYPGAGMDLIRGLFQKCDFYLDINHEGEIVSAVYRAFIHNHLIFAFEETVHNRDYVAERWIYPVKEWYRMVEDIRVIMEDAELLDRCLKRQREEAMSENNVTYGKLLGWEIC